MQRLLVLTDSLAVTAYAASQNRGEVALAVGAYSGALALLGQSDEGRSSLAWAAIAANAGACYRAMAEGARTPWERLQLLENSLAYTTQALAVRASSLPEGHESIGDTLSSLGGALRAASVPDLAGTAHVRGGGGAALAERVGRTAVSMLDAAAGAGRDSSMWATAASNLSLLLLQPLPQAVAAAAEVGGGGSSVRADDGVQEEEADEEEDGDDSGDIRVHATDPPQGAADKAQAEAEQWRATEAEGLLRQALSVRRKRLGKVHPDTIETMLLLSRAVLAAGAGSGSAEAEAASIRATADALFAQLQTMQQEDDHSQQGRV
jgi:hypothetical protein